MGGVMEGQRIVLTRRVGSFLHQDFFHCLLRRSMSIGRISESIFFFSKTCHLRRVHLVFESIFLPRRWYDMNFISVWPPTTFSPPNWHFSHKTRYIFFFPRGLNHSIEKSFKFSCGSDFQNFPITILQQPDATIHWPHILLFSPETVSFFLFPNGITDNYCFPRSNNLYFVPIFFSIFRIFFYI